MIATLSGDKGSSGVDRGRVQPSHKPDFPFPPFGYDKGSAKG